MIEEVLVTARYNAKVDPLLGIWTWEIAVYLFLGGLTAGVMIFSALVHLTNQQEKFRFSAWQLPLWAPIILSIGMTTLFLDLEHKLYVFRFYTTLQMGSPMSWGSWVLLLVYALCVLMILATLRRGYPSIAAWFEKLPLVSAVFDLAEKWTRIIAFWSIPIAIAMGIYTGILLSSFSARPFWNSSVLGVLFLVSGISTAAALIALAARQEEERHWFAKLDAGIIVVELVLIASFIIGLSTGGLVQLEALNLIMEGDFAIAFWGLFVVVGLIVPLVLELLPIRKLRMLMMMAPLLVLFGGYMLRHVAIEVGQTSTWNNYSVQFDPALLERLR